MLSVNGDSHIASFLINMTFLPLSFCPIEPLRNTSMMLNRSVLKFKLGRKAFSLVPLSTGEGNGNPLQYSCLENPVDGGAWQSTIHWVAKNQARLSNFTVYLSTIKYSVHCRFVYIFFSSLRNFVSL